MTLAIRGWSRSPGDHRSVNDAAWNRSRVRHRTAAEAVPPHGECRNRNLDRHVPKAGHVRNELGCRVPIAPSGERIPKRGAATSSLAPTTVGSALTLLPLPAPPMTRSSTPEASTVAETMTTTSVRRNDNKFR